VKKSAESAPETTTKRGEGGKGEKGKDGFGKAVENLRKSATDLRQIQGEKKDIHKPWLTERGREGLLRRKL